MDKVRNELLQGTLDLLILRTLSTSSLHGWDIAKRIAIVSNERLSLKQGSLYPALHRLEGRGSIEAEWGMSDAGRSQILSTYSRWSARTPGREGTLAFLCLRRGQRPQHGRIRMIAERFRWLVQNAAAFSAAVNRRLPSTPRCSFISINSSPNTVTTACPNARRALRHSVSSVPRAPTAKRSATRGARRSWRICGVVYALQFARSRVVPDSLCSPSLP